MGVVAQIKGAVNSAVARVTSNGALRVTDAVRPAKDWSQVEVEQLKNLSEQLQDASSSGDMAVDGSTTAQDFFIAAEEGKIKWVTGVTLTHHDSQMRLDNNEIRRFGSAAAAPGLTNGVRLITRQSGEDSDLFLAGGVSNIGEYYRFTPPDMAHGVTDAVSASVDFLVVHVLFAKPVGLYPGSADRVIVQVQDDLSTMTLFAANAVGWYELL